MLKEEISVPMQMMILVDLFLVSLSFFVGYGIRHSIQGLYPLTEYIGLLPIILAIWGVLLLNYIGSYCFFRIDKIAEIVMIIFKIMVIGFAVFGSVTYAFKIPMVSRTLIFMIFFSSAVLISLEKILLILILKVVRRRGFNSKNMLIAGTGKRAQDFIRLIDANVEWGYNILGLVDGDPKRIGDKICGYEVLGTLEEVPEIVHHNVVDEVVFIVPRSWLDRIEKVIFFCEDEGITVKVAVDLFELKLANAVQTDIDGLHLLSFKMTPDKLWHLMVKRLFDIAVSGAALVLLSPLLAAAAVLIKLTSAGPVFFRQERCGLHGRNFQLYKFRTMGVDAENKLKDLIAQNEMKGPAFKMENDPRITKWGRFLRKYSIDELPQLWNVFTGDMSLVGPRPPIPSEVNLYDPWHRRRLSMKPGITCLWQVNGRNKITDFNEWVKLDLQYIDQWSLWLECKILLKTVPVVLSGSGAK